VDTLTVAGRHDLTDTQWAVLEALLPKAKKTGRPPRWTKRQLVDGIRWRIRAGTPWRDVPDRYGSWAAVYALFRRWQRDGTWARLLTALQALANAAGRIHDRQRLLPLFAAQVQLGGQPATGTTQRVIGRLLTDSTRWFGLQIPLLRAPAAC
jgi:transposase